MPTLDCRVARLEAHMTTVQENHKDHLSREDEKQEQIMALLQEVRDKQAKMAGFWAGAVFVVGAVATAASLFFNKFATGG